MSSAAHSCTAFCSSSNSIVPEWSVSYCRHTPVARSEAAHRDRDRDRQRQRQSQTETETETETHTAISPPCVTVGRGGRAVRSAEPVHKRLVPIDTVVSTAPANASLYRMAVKMSGKRRSLFVKMMSGGVQYSDTSSGVGGVRLQLFRKEKSAHLQIVRNPN